MEVILLAGYSASNLEAGFYQVDAEKGGTLVKCLLKHLYVSGIDRAIVPLESGADCVKRFLGRESEGVEIEYIEVENGLGSGGKVARAMEKVEGENVLVVNGDVFFELNIPRLFELHMVGGGAASVAMRRMEDVSGHDVMTVNEDCQLVGYGLKTAITASGLVNSGVLMLNKKQFMGMAMEGAFSLEEDYLKKYFHSESIFAMEFDGDFLRIGALEKEKKKNYAFEKVEGR